MQAPTAKTTLSEIVEANPQRARLFAARRLDFCCGGTKTLQEACDRRGLEVDQILDELAAVDQQSNDSATREFGSMAELIDHIVEQHHGYLRAELGPLERIVTKVERVHGNAHPELHEVARAYRELASELLAHLDEEEEDVFPALTQLIDGATGASDAVADQLDKLVDEHEHVGDLLEQIHALTDGFGVPEGACASYRNMLARLEQLELDTHMHVHRENNVLFSQVRAQLA